MSQRPSTPGSSARQSPIATKKEKHDLPPSYNTIPNSLSIGDFSPHHSGHGTLRREKPPPPQRTSSNPQGDQRSFNTLPKSSATSPRKSPKPDLTPEFECMEQCDLVSVQL
ncbi:unnamed protein product [Acanthoscelides obtectus]|uniref:Uncharacterized protein n=1 Tax=Acanthoscelides obtectus TaxID=200917 RepID=A0A9P0K7Z8_ACAOB|nr:unnamed protein product [Acanthoscelides obtectus]CAK1666367.1 hypothetical protein AOBTE_LOCUS25275 [Acanthoscelides obtectus]